MRLTGRVEYILSWSPEIYGSIESNGIVGGYVLHGRNLEGYGGESLYKFGLVNGATVSFDIEQGSNTALNIRVENKPSKVLLAFRASRGNLARITLLSVCIGLILLFKNIAAYLFVALLALWVIKNCQDIYRNAKDIFN